MMMNKNKSINMCASVYVCKKNGAQLEQTFNEYGFWQRTLTCVQNNGKKRIHHNLVAHCLHMHA